MKRGLVTLNTDETPREAYWDRLAALQARLQETNSGLALIYGDVSRSGDINYLTNLCLYWNEAILAVPATGKPALITKLSKRVQPWMKKISVLEDIRSGPRLGENIGRLLDDRAGTRETRIMIVDAPWWPNPVMSEVRQALPGARFEDGGSAVRDTRLVPSPVEARLLERAACLLEEGVQAAWQEGKNDHDRTALAVRSIRRAGFADASVTCRTSSDGSEHIDAIGQYRYVWARLAQPKGGAMADVANSALKAAAARIMPGVTERMLNVIVQGQVARQFPCTFWCIPHPDIETRGLFRSVTNRERRLRDGEVVSLTVCVAGKADAVTASRMLRVRSTGPEALAN